MSDRVRVSRRAALAAVEQDQVRVKEILSELSSQYSGVRLARADIVADIFASEDGRRFRSDAADARSNADDDWARDIEAELEAIRSASTNSRMLYLFQKLDEVDAQSSRLYERLERTRRIFEGLVTAAARLRGNGKGSTCVLFVYDVVPAESSEA